MANKGSRAAVIGVFRNQAAAEQAVLDLRRAGFWNDQIGMVYRDAEGETVKTGAAEETYAEEGAALGAAAGAAGGALLGPGSWPG